MASPAHDRAPAPWQHSCLRGLRRGFRPFKMAKKYPLGCVPKNRNLRPSEEHTGRRGHGCPGATRFRSSPSGPWRPSTESWSFKKVLEMLWPSPWKRGGYSPSSQLFVLIVVSGEEVIAKWNLKKGKKQNILGTYESMYPHTSECKNTILPKSKIWAKCSFLKVDCFVFKVARHLAHLEWDRRPSPAWLSG